MSLLPVRRPTRNTKVREHERGLNHQPLLHRQDNSNHCAIGPLRRVLVPPRSNRRLVSNAPIVGRKHGGQVANSKTLSVPQQKVFFTTTSNQFPSTLRRGPTTSPQALQGHTQQKSTHRQPQEVDHVHISSIKSPGISRKHGSQEEKAHLTRTLSKPVDPLYKLNVVKPQKG
ncbi:hypothetical protein KIN20_005085 [Parelaphostrongylus tenuis]|uniref:Uncharacterized protein n=1 Tax=Parelaphostrongylus tenuis TaxID=148309 RepID=A0AAD5MKU4_PARTN|nr:hypothetical protein KIN20_005085 [Parelaphostrongylus tenuis]